MHLTKKQKDMLSGDESEATQKAMEILVGLGDIYKAESLIPITSAHISGISIRTSGEAGLNFIEDMVVKGAKISVPTTINPAGIDLEKWRSLGAPEDMSKKQIRMIDAFKEMGVKTTCSCVPYLIGNKPSFGEHIAWSESSAIVYANSVLGARTNREGAPSALASAITGLTPSYGYHLDENREGTIKINLETNMFKGEGTFPYSVLGYWIGENFPKSVPVIDGITPSKNQHKALGAGMASSGAVSLYHIPGNTIEAKKNPKLCETEEAITYSSENHKSVINKLDQTSDTDIICLGCPHASIGEIKNLLEKAAAKKTWVCMPRELKEKIKPKLLQEIKKSNIELVCDTCMVVAPLKQMGYSSIGVNSTKAAHYAPSLAGVKVHLASTGDLVK